MELGKEEHKLFASLRVEVAGGFVGEEDGRVVDERSGDGDPLLFAAGEVARLVAPPITQTDLVESVLGERESSLCWYARVEEWERHITQCIGASQQVESLENEAELAIRPLPLGASEVVRPIDIFFNLALCPPR